MLGSFFGAPPFHPDFCSRLARLRDSASELRHVARWTKDLQPRFLVRTQRRRNCRAELWRCPRRGSCPR